MRKQKVESIQAARLKKTHATLEQKIAELSPRDPSYDFKLRSLKREKLLIRDKIARLESETPGSESAATIVETTKLADGGREHQVRVRQSTSMPG